MSSICILTALVTDALPPIKPLINAKSAAVTKFLEPVAGEPTVLPHWTPALNWSILAYAGIWAKISNGPLLVVRTLAVSASVHNLLNVVGNPDIPSILPICTTFIVSLAALAAASFGNTCPAFNITLASESYICLFATALIILDVVNNTLFFKFLSCPKSFAITAGNSSPSFKNPSKFNLSPTFLRTSNGFLLSTLPNANICLIITLA